MEQFISNSPSVTPAMKVIVTNECGDIHKTYEVEPGFQLEKYVASLHPNATLNIDFPKNINNKNTHDFRVKVYDEKKMIEIHLGVYKE